MNDLTACLKTSEHVDFPLDGGGTAPFRVAFDGFGCVSVAAQDEATLLHLRSGAASSHDETHAALALGPETSGNFELSAGVRTAEQIRTGGLPNPHEVGWLVWNYADNDHFYYLAAKPNGWELGKRDPAFPGGQQFLATDTHPKFGIGERHELRINQSGATIDAWIDGAHLATYTDARPYDHGRIGFYCEDSEVFFDGLRLASKP